MFLGIPDPWIYGALILCIASTLLCIVYGLKNWNKGDESDTEFEKNQEWLEHEIEAEEKM